MIGTNADGIIIPSEVRAVLFDCDGVLIDSWDSTMFFFNYLRAQAGLGPMSPEEERESFFHTVEESLERMIPAALLPKAIAAKETVPFEELFKRVRRTPGIRSFLSRLRETGRQLAVVTNGGAEQYKILGHVDLLDSFDRIITTEDVRQGKPSPEGVRLLLDEFGLAPEQAIFVGDSVTDHGAANNAGVPFWAYCNADLPARVHFSNFGQVRLG